MSMQLMDVIVAVWRNVATREIGGHVLKCRDEEKRDKQKCEHDWVGDNDTLFGEGSFRTWGRIWRGDGHFDGDDFEIQNFLFPELNSTLEKKRGEIYFSI